MTKICTLKRLPFNGEWLVFWGGDTKEQNRHHDVIAQKYAFDFIKINSARKTVRQNEKLNEEYYSFSEEVLSADDGIVIEAVDGIRDNIPPDTNDYMPLGNYIIIQKDDVYCIYAHLKKESVSVMVGDAVKAGQRIGECGNSGYSSEPHLHFHVQDSIIFSRFTANYEKQPVACGIKIEFRDMKVNGAKRQNYSPVKGDKLST